MSTGPLPQKLPKLFACLFLLATTVSTSLSQQSFGSIKGIVTDQLGALVANAKVIVRDANGSETSVNTNATGNYWFRNLRPGKYELLVIAPGFNLFEKQNVIVAAGANIDLDVELSVGLEEESVTIDERGVSTDADRNADALVLRGRELEALPTDPEALTAALQAMAGPGAEGQSGAQVTVDGFSGGQIPPKEAIREVRINQNPFSAEYEFPGFGGIEIFTQPGSDKWHGGANFRFNDESLNSRNPFSPRRAPYQQRSFGGNLTGPIIKKRASFAFQMMRYATDANTIVNATMLDSATLRPILFNQSFVTPQSSNHATFRGDLKISKKHTLVGSYSHYRNSQPLQGFGGFSLPSRAYAGKGSYHTLQLTETAVINEKMINETRLQIIHNVFRQTGNTTAPALNVQDSFFGGGAQVGSASNEQDRAELQNFTSWSVGSHFLKIGARVRHLRVRSVSPANFGGTYTFAGGIGPRLDTADQVILESGQPETVDLSSLERYRRTLVFARQGLTAEQIRNMGGGATQFSIAGGDPAIGVSQTDVALYVQDEWKVRPNFTISPGLRYENQTNVSSHLNFAPRVAFAWSPVFGIFGDAKKTSSVVADKNAAEVKRAPAPAVSAAPRQSRTVIRGGIGIFYNRISEDLILQTARFNGINQRQFIVSDPAVLDLFPIVPPIALLEAFAQPQTRRFISAALDPAYTLRGTMSLERQLPQNLRVVFTFSHSRTLRSQRMTNINAPTSGGLRPLGQSTGNILEYQSNGRSVYQGLSVNVNGRMKKGSLWTNYHLAFRKNTDSGASGSPFDAYDFSNEWGRAPFDTRHSFYGGGNYQGPLGLTFNTFIVGNSGQRFNITTGQDTNVDTFFSDRPAFATELNKPGVIITRFGALDPNPAPGQRIIPRNLGKGPGFLSVNVGVEKSIKFGPAIPPKSPPVAAPETVAGASSSTPPPKQPIQRPYQVGFLLYASNLLNRNNRGTPVGNMASPRFLQSTGPSSTFFFGPDGAASGNRQLTLMVRFSF